jgi:hypothetical protein
MIEGQVNKDNREGALGKRFVSYVRKRTTRDELRMENQCTWSSVIMKYESHREAHLMSLL